MIPRSKELENVSVAVFVLIILFSMSSWLDVVGVWVEMPLLTAVLPEGWNLPSYMAIIIQLANIGPASYAIVHKIRQTQQKSSVDGKIDVEVIISYLIIAVAGVSVLLMAFLWEKQAVVFGSLHSVALLSLMGSTALSSCTSAVIFLPYMARFATPYVSAYYIGQGFSGLVPGLIGLIQGIGHYDCVIKTNNISLGNNSDYLFSNFTDTAPINQTVSINYREPKFSVRVFFICLTSLFIISGMAFFILNFSRVGKSAMNSRKQVSKQNGHTSQSNGMKVEETDTCFQTLPSNGIVSSSNNSLVANRHIDQRTSQDVSDYEKIKDIDHSEVKQPKQLPQGTFIALLIIVGSVAALSNGLLPSTQSYTCLPYGSLVYTLALRLSSIAGPLASLSSMLLPKATTKVIFSLALLGTCIAMFHILLASLSPNPFLRGHVIGEIIVIVSSIVMSACFSFVRVSVAMLLHRKGGRRELFWCGGVTQIGSFCGALVAFVLVSVLHVFTSRKPCT